MTLVYLAGAWLLGVVAGAAAGELWWPGVAAIGAAGLAAGALERRPQLAVVGLLAAGVFVAGGARYVDQRPPDEPTGVAVHNDAGPVQLRALVTDEPDVPGRSQRVRLSVREVLDGGAWRETSGGVLLRTNLYPRYEYGDVLEIAGELETPPSFPDFDYRDFLARQGVVSMTQFPEVRTIATGEGERPLEVLHDVRGRLGEALAETLPEPQAALAQGIFLGQRSAIPQDLTDDLNATGTSHLVAISGHNVSLVAALIIAALAWVIGRRQAALVALIAIAGYTALTGASPSVVRAAIMGSLFVVATLAGRPASAATSIALAAAIMTGLEPLVIEDVSFQLSFAAIAGLVYLAPPLQARGADALRSWGIEPEGAAGFLLESSAVTAGAVAATLPLIALNFERISLVAPISNLFLVPAFPLILVSSAVTAGAGAVWEPLGQATAVFSWAMLTYMIEVARFFADIPLASLDISGFGAAHAAIAYLALALGAWWLVRRRPADTAVRTPERLAMRAAAMRPAWLLAGGLALVSTITWYSILDADEGRLSVSVLDVGQGDAILIESPDGRQVLVDGGADGRRLLGELGDELPFWDRAIDVVALTHPQEDHLAGLIDALERYDVGQVIATPREADTDTYHEWRDLIGRRGIPYREAGAGDAIDLGGGARLEVLGPTREALASGDVNDASLVLKLTWGEVSFLLTGDIEVRGEEALLASGADLRSTVLKLAHHGSNTSSSAAFLRAVEPAVAVVSVGADNTFGHPSPEVLQRLSESAVFRTDRHGTVRLSTDGERLWVEAERSGR